MRAGYIILFITLLFSCTRQEPYPSDSCLGELNIGVADLCGTMDLPEQFCMERYQGKFSLQESSKNYLPFYCRELREKIQYENETGEIMEFEVVEKAFTESHRYDYFLQCPEDTTKHYLECYDVDIAYVIIRSPMITLKLELSPWGQYLHDKEKFAVGDDLWIYRESNYTSNFIVAFVAVLYQGEREVNNAPCRALFPEVVLNGNTFYDVIAYVEDMDCAHYRFWINADEGLVAFNLPDEGIWSFKK